MAECDIAFLSGNLLVLVRGIEKGKDYTGMIVFYD